MTDMTPEQVAEAVERNERRKDGLRRHSHKAATKLSVSSLAVCASSRRILEGDKQ